MKSPNPARDTRQRTDARVGKRPFQRKRDDANSKTNSPNPATDTRQRTDARVGKRPFQRKREDANSKMSSPNPARDTRQRTDARVGKRPFQRKREDANSKMNSPNPARDTRQRTDARVGKRPFQRKREDANSEKNSPNPATETPVNEPMLELENGPSRESEKTRNPRWIRKSCKRHPSTNRCASWKTALPEKTRRRELQKTPVIEPMPELVNGPSRESEKTRTPR